mmetsp:Transcript_1318/g.3803  ORF Transcript_1318/g.3803 Transcript_1318/m.3803 type:complete len:215 (+) Transcript_1318:1023-1667(+)
MLGLQQLLPDSQGLSKERPCLVQAAHEVQRGPQVRHRGRHLFMEAGTSLSCQQMCPPHLVDHRAVSNEHGRKSKGKGRRWMGRGIVVLHEMPNLKMVTAELPDLYGKSLSEKLFRLPVLSPYPQVAGQVAGGSGVVHVLITDIRLDGRHGAAVELFRFGLVVCSRQHYCEVVESLSDVSMVGAKHLLPDVEGPPQDRCGSLVVLARSQQQPEVV